MRWNTDISDSESSATDIYDTRLKLLATQLRNGEELDWNSLDFVDQQAVHALIDSGEADYATSNGRRVVCLSFLAQHPFLNMLMFVMSMGSSGSSRLGID